MLSSVIWYILSVISRTNHLNHLNYFGDDLIRKNNLDRQKLLQMAQGAPITDGFRELIRELYLVADEYRKETFRMMQEIKPCLEPCCQLSLEIIFTLYLMVFERIDIENGLFTTRELNPTPDEIKERVRRTIVGFEAV